MTVAKLDICNAALKRCGNEPILIAELTTATTKRGIAVTSQFELTLREHLNDTTWNFATDRFRLTRSTDPLYGFGSSYSMPSSIIRIIETNKVDPYNLNAFRVEGRKVLTNYDDGVKSAAITRVGAVAAVVVVGHGYNDGETINVSGATQTEYNGSFVITYIDADTFSYTVTGTPATPATGTIYTTRETAVLYAKAIWYQDDVSVWSPTFTKSFYLKLAEDISYQLVQSSSLQQAIITEANRYLRIARSYNSQEGTPESRYPENYTLGLRL